MHKKTILLAVTTLGFFVAGCASTAGTDGEAKAAQDSPPEWVNKSCWVEEDAGEPVYHGVGLMAGIADPKMAHMQAGNRARAEVAKCYQVTISQSEGDGSKSIKTYSAQTFSARIVDHYVAHDGTVYAHAAGKPAPPPEESDAANTP